MQLVINIGSQWNSIQESILKTLLDNKKEDVLFKFPVDCHEEIEATYEEIHDLLNKKFVMKQNKRENKQEYDSLYDL